MSGGSSAVAARIALISNGLASGCAARTSAARPARCGAANELPVARMRDRHRARRRRRRGRRRRTRPAAPGCRTRRPDRRRRARPRTRPRRTATGTTVPARCSPRTRAACSRSRPGRPARGTRAAIASLRDDRLRLTTPMPLGDRPVEGGGEGPALAAVVRARGRGSTRGPRPARWPWMIPAQAVPCPTRSAGSRVVHDVRTRRRPARPGGCGRAARRPPGGPARRRSR